jgi:DNA-binding MarR family transcriptional regulator
MEPGRLKKTREFADKVSTLLAQITQNSEAFEHACVNYFGVTASQGGTLLNLPAKQSIPMNELSTAAGVDNSTMTRMVDQLVEKGLVLRQADEKDRRLVRIGLAPAGQKLRQELTDALANFYIDSLEEIPEEERITIINSLERLKDSIAKGLETCCNKYCNRQG